MDPAEAGAADPTGPADTRDGGGDQVTLKVAADGPGTFRTVSRDRATTRDRGRVLRYDVRIERGLPFSGSAVAKRVQTVLSDRRSWTGDGSVRFSQVAAGGRVDFTVFLATPGTTDELCAPLLTRGQVSCQNGRRVVLNAERWAFGAPSKPKPRAYGDDVATYRIYLVNHEVGHVLGHQHVGCSHRGARASVMMQQTKGLDGCRANPWPAPNRH